MQKAVPDQENCRDVQIWTDNGNTYNNRVEHAELFLIDNWLTTDPDFASTSQIAENFSSASEVDTTSWHEQWTPLPVKRQSSDQQKREDRREKKRRSAKESRERAKQSNLREKENNKCLTKLNAKLHDDVEKLRDKVHNLEIVKKSIIHQESCKDKNNTVDINDNSSVCSMPLQIVEKRKDYGLIFSGKSTTNDNNVTGYSLYQRQGQHSVEQEVGTQQGLCSTQDYMFATADSDVFCSSDANFQQFSGTSQAAMALNESSIQTYSVNLNTTNNQPSLIPVDNFSTQLSKFPVNSNLIQTFLVNNVPNQTSSFPVKSVSNQTYLLPIRNISDQSPVFPANRGLDQISQLPVRNVSELMTINTGQLHNTALFSNQSNPTCSQHTPQSHSRPHSSDEQAWCVKTNQNDNKEKEELINFFLE